MGLGDFITFGLGSSSGKSNFIISNGSKILSLLNSMEDIQYAEFCFPPSYLEQECLSVEGVPSAQHIDHKNIYNLTPKIDF